MKKILQTFLTNILGERNFFLLIGFIVNKYYPYKLLKKYKKTYEAKEEVEQIVYMADGRIRHGGLSDRLKGIVSLYLCSKELNIPFKIHFIHPFNIEEFLMPNEVSWKISSVDLTYNSLESLPIVLITTATNCKQDKKEKDRLKTAIKDSFRKKYKQLHCYTSSGFGDSDFHSLFNELFVPSPLLSEQINTHLEKVGCEYISIVFRFQNLLGDFYEGNFRTLNSCDQEVLLKKCIDIINEIYESNSYLKILVTSDSFTFLEKVKGIKYIYVIPGSTVHMDFVSDALNKEYLKSFVDLFMLSKSKKIFLARTSRMYKSGFAKRAALVGNVPYEEYIIS